MHNVTDAIDLSGRVAVAAVDFHSTRIYALDSPDHSVPEHVVAEDPRKRFHNVYHHHGSVRKGTKAVPKDNHRTRPRLGGHRGTKAGTGADGVPRQLQQSGREAHSRARQRNVNEF